ncbi:heavy metal-binding domain-containing protein [Gordonia sinesedis]
MIIVTTNDIPGYRIAHVFGETFGLTVRSRNIGSNIGAGFKAMAGGELKGITQLLHDCRQEALGRLAAEAQQMGANAVLAFRFETTEFGGTGIEVCAYGTAVGIEPLGSAPAAPPAAPMTPPGPPA